jgi:UDP-N-acetyl-2-amino-2-deoxyglucuronate dehydrogenase
MIRFGLIGCGRISKKHIEALKLDNAKLVAACDIDYAKIRELERTTDLAVYHSYDKMLRCEAIDAVCILTPNGLHAEHVIDIATNYRKHIICEKPMALTSKDAQNMIDVCKEAGVKLFVVKQNRFNFPVVKLLEAVKAGRFGKLVLGTIRVRWCRDQEYYTNSDWHGTKKLDGGVLWTQASHHIDLLLQIMGKPKKFSLMTANRLLSMETEDTAVATIEFESGALGVIEATVATRPTDLEGSISILGENGTVEVGGFALNQMKTWKFKDSERDEEREVEYLFSEQPPGIYGNGHQRYMQAVVDCIENNLDPKDLNLADGQAGKEVVDFIEKIYQNT